MTRLPDLTPLALCREGNHFRFTLAAQDDILPELPADYEHLLAEQLTDLLAESPELTVEISLEGVAGLSSRQLGSLIALQKVLRPRFGRTRITGASASVRHLLAMTHMEQLFDLE